MFNQDIFPVSHAPIKTGVEKLHDYLIDRNPEGVKKVLMLNGYRSVTTDEQMREALLRMAAKGDESSLFQLIAEHPDYDLIAADVARKQEDSPVQVVAAQVAAAPHTFSLDLDKFLSVLLFLVLAGLVLKLFKD